MIKKNMFQTCPNLLTGFETKREPTCATTKYLILHVFVAQMLYQLSCIYLHRDLAPQYLGAFWKNQLEQNASHPCLVSGRPAFAKVLGAHLT
jgi:hypothetical protein